MFTFLLLSSILSSEIAPSSDEDTLRIMVWNIQRGSNHFEEGPEKALHLIRQADADVYLLQESYDIDGDRPTLGRWMAKELNWNVWQGKSPHLCLLTPLDIQTKFYHHDWHGLGAQLKDPKGREFIAYTTWIDYRSYLPYELRDHPERSDEELLACESEKSNRLPQAKALLAHLDDAGHLDAACPILVGGDWNCPSHLDWTEDSSIVFRFRRPLPLPVSLAMKERGFIDTFRSVHPDPTRVPGLTWSPLYRSKDEVPTPADRIDRLYLKLPEGQSTLVPVRAEVWPRVLEDAEIPIEKRQFPSDHGAVIVDLRWSL